jgi:hypothetical protein
MSGRRLQRAAALLVLAGAVAGVLAWLAIVRVDARAASVTPAAGDEAAAPTSAPSSDDRRLRSELDRLADAWSLGGGRFGYPFWEKASQRWRSGELSTALLREYVTGYRDRLRPGCDLLDATDVDSDVARDVRSLAKDSCSRRLEALRAQQRWLDALVEREVAARAPAAPAGAQEDPGARAKELAELEAQATAQEEAYREAIQESYRDARLALDLAQRELDHAGVQRLPEDAFV